MDSALVFTANVISPELGRIGFNTGNQSVKDSCECVRLYPSHSFLNSVHISTFPYFPNASVKTDIPSMLHSPGLGTRGFQSKILLFISHLLLSFLRPVSWVFVVVFK